LLDIMKETGKKLSQLADELTLYPQLLENITVIADTKYPQLLENITVKHKKEVLENERVKAAIEEAEASLGESGRVLVRPSGTEPLVRVMIEAETEDLCKQYTDQIINAIKEVSE